MRAHDHNTEYYYYVDEETSELIKEYYFARDLTLTLGNRDLIHALGIQFKCVLHSLLFSSTSLILMECLVILSSASSRNWKKNSMKRPSRIIKHSLPTRVTPRTRVMGSSPLSKNKSTIKWQFSLSLSFYVDSVVGEFAKPSYFHSSISVPSDFAHNEASICDAAASFSEQKK